MVTANQAQPQAPDRISDLELRIDGGRAPAAESVSALTALCGRAEDSGAGSPEAGRFVILRLSGTPGPHWSGDLTVALVNKWERALRRLERLPALIIAVVEADCGGPALDALLAADYRVMAEGARLVVPAVSGTSWPGMALYRLARQAAGSALARQAMLSGTSIGAADAQAAGLIDEVSSRPASALRTAVETLGAAPGAEIAIRRQLMQEALNTPFEEALGAHLAACDRSLRSAATGAV